MNLKGLKEKFNKSRFSAFILLALLVSIFLDWLVKIFRLIPNASIVGGATIADRIYFITFLGLIWYAWETRGMKEQMILQNEVEQEPLMTIFLRDSQSKEFEGRNFNIPFRYFLGSSFFIFRLRNIGRGPAFNVTVQSNKFIGVNFETQLFAPLKDEHCVQIVVKGSGNDFFDIKELNNEEFFISCNDSKGKKHTFKYKILHSESRVIAYLCKF